MFDFLHRSAPRYPTIREALSQSGVAAASDTVGVTVLERHGLYSGREVSFFRAFKPIDASQLAVEIRGFADLDTHQDLVLGAGHVEHDGQVILSRGIEQERSTPLREPADRSAHADDARFVFWDSDRARSAEGALSQPAAVWLHAMATASPGVKPERRLTPPDAS